MPAEQKGAEMPKQQINKPQRRHVVDNPNEDSFSFRYLTDHEDLPSGVEHSHMEDSPILYVGWHGPDVHGVKSEDGCVQVHVDIAEEEILRMAEEINREREERKRNAPNDATIDSQPGVWWSRRVSFKTTMMTRNELNRFIKTLQKARNTAFGADL